MCKFVGCHVQRMTCDSKTETLLLGCSVVFQVGCLMVSPLLFFYSYKKTNPRLISVSHLPQVQRPKKRVPKKASIDS